MNKQQEASLTATRHRREFLKTFGAVVGGLAINQFSFSSAEAKSSKSKSLPGISSLPSIGLVLPKSDICPHLGSNFADGMRVCFDQLDAQSGCGKGNLLVEEVETSRAAAVKKARHLITEGKAELLVGMMGPNTAIDLHDVLESNRTFLILADVGANVVRESEQSPYVFHASLGYWRSNWAMGEWAVRNVGRKAFVASSFYESGYDALYAFRLGVEKAGGKIAQTYISHVPPNLVDMNHLMEAIKSVRPEFVFASYCGEEAVDFVKAYNASGLLKQIPLVCSSFMVDEPLLKKLGPLTQDIRSCLSWTPRLRTHENTSFTTAFEEKTGRPADAFAALGYETARLIIDAVHATGGNLRNNQGVRNAFRATTFTGPRGAVWMDPATHELLTPHYLREVRYANGGFVNEVIDELKPAAEHNHTLVAFRGEIRTGWMNSYLMV